MRAEEHALRALERANRYYEPAMRAAEQGVSVYREIEPQLQRLARQMREVEDYPRFMLVCSFTFARGGWHNAPLLEMASSQFRTIVNGLVDKPNHQVKKELDAGIPEYLRAGDYAVLWDMIDRWDFYPGWRRRVFEEAFWAHKNGRYSLSVSALTPQIEGMLRHETGAYARRAPWLQKINNALGFTYDAESPPTVEDLKEALDELLTQPLPLRYERAEQISLDHALFRVNELFNSGSFSDPEFVNSTNRHAILHGVAEDFGELESSKLFCTVQLVHEIVEAYREAGLDHGRPVSS